ncbi:MAG: hypothetical protein ACYC3L_04715 [Gemmatimonadaceae bacterium]
MLYTLGVNVDVAWYVLLALSLVAFFLAVWRLAGSMGLDDRERALLVMAIAATPIYRGTLNWSAQPMLSFITASVAVPIGLLAIAFAIESRLTPALVLAALAFDVHPSLGLCAGMVVISIGPWRAQLQALRGAWLPAALVAAPNLAYLVLHRPAPGGGSNARLWDVFNIFGYHTFIRDHWRDGYPWVALAVALAVIGARQVDTVPARRALQAALVLLGLATAWILCMNFAPIPALMPLYLIRASLLAKPLILGLALTTLTRRRYAGKYALLAPFTGALAVSHPDRLVAEAALAITLGIVLRPSKDRRRAAAGAAAWACGLLALFIVISRRVDLLDFVMSYTTTLRWTTFALGVIAAGLLLSSPPAAEGSLRTTRGWPTLPIAIALPVLAVVLMRPFGRGWLPESSVAVGRRLFLSRALPKEAGAMRWARDNSPPASLFAVPPLDNDWLRFRLAAQRGIYASVHDINQLMYVRNAVFPAVDRLTTLGVIVKGSHNFDAKGYLHPTCARLQQLARDGVGYYVLPVESVAPAGSVIAYHDVNYDILDVWRTVQGCGA